MNKHSKYSPSSAFRWTVCNGSVKYSNLSESNSFAKEGNKAHLVAFDKDEFFNCEDRIMRYFAIKLHNYINSILKKNKYNIYIEYKVTHGVIKELYGTADYIAFNDEELHIFDYKYGFKKVSAVWNTQLLTYAICSFYTFNLEKVEKIYLHIIQPRINNIELFSVTKQDLYAFNKIINKSIVTENYQYVPGEIQCQFCPGKLLKKCPAILEKDLEKK